MHYHHSSYSSMLLFASSILLSLSLVSAFGNHEQLQPLRIAVLASKDDDECLTMLQHLPSQAEIVAQGVDLEAMKAGAKANSIEDVECLLVVSGTGEKVEQVMKEMKALKWIHGIFAGLDHMKSPTFDNCSDERDIVVTNAKGVFSSSLAEWCLGAAWYWSKDIVRLNKNKEEKNYDRYSVGELRGKTMGIIGYGDIGRSVAKLAKAYGMKVVAHRRRPELSQEDPLVDKVYGNDDIKKVMGVSDFLVVAAALTPETEGMLGREELEAAKRGQIFMNIGRGKLVDEAALIDMLRAGDRIHAAALDVFCVEPLPTSSPLWTLPNVLLSPHNADMVINFRHDSVKFFTDNVKRYATLGRKGLQNVVNPKLGY